MYLAGVADAGARAIQVAGLHAHVNLRDEHRLPGAIGQRDALLDQPDDVGSELGHLGCREGDAGAQAVGFGEGQAGVHQGAVFLLVAGVVAEEALAGEGHYLFAD